MNPQQVCICIFTCVVVHVYVYVHFFHCLLMKLFLYVGRGKSYQQLVGNLKVSSLNLQRNTNAFGIILAKILAFVLLTERRRCSHPQHEVQSKHESEYSVVFFFFNYYSELIL